VSVHVLEEEHEFLLVIKVLGVMRKRLQAEVISFPPHLVTNDPVPKSRRD
jgi:hypothetical protein